MKISFLASHGGSSARHIIAAMREGRLDAEPGILITNNRDAPIRQWCLDNDIKVLHISSKTHGNEDKVDQAIASALYQAGSKLVVCSGYMKKIGPDTLRHFPYKILNIHPALLPDFGGKGMYGDLVHQAVLAAGKTESGATAHYVTDGIDEGPIIKQHVVPVYKDDTLDTLRSRVQACEPGLYLSALTELLQGE